MRRSFSLGLAAALLASLPAWASPSSGGFDFGNALPSGAIPGTGSAASGRLKSAASRANGYPMALKYIIQEGVKPVYLGSTGGVIAYLGVSPAGRIQTFYVWPNGVDVVAGVMFDAAGHNVSMRQLSAMKTRFMEAADGGAVDPTPSATHPAMMMDGKDPAAIPAMRHIISQPGVRSLYLGGDGGTPSYAVTSTNGGMEFCYPTPNGHDVVVGMMFGVDGRNLTAAQVAEHQIVFRSFLKGGNGGTRIAGTPAPSGPAQAASPAPAAQPPAAELPTAPMSTKAPAAPPASPPSQHAVMTPGVTKAQFEAVIPYTASFPVGNPNAPVVWMFSDPQCPYCHADWDDLKPLVLAGKINVHVVLVDRVQSSEKYNLAIMSQPNPGIAWLRGWGSSANLGNIPAPPPAGSSQFHKAATWLSDNMAAVGKLHITATPYFAYTDKAGRFHAAQGPRSVTAFLRPLIK